MARLLASQPSPVWLYHFTRVSPGAKRTRMVAQAMHAAWFRFAKTGDPNGGDLPKWPAYTTDNDTHLEFGDTTKTGRGLWRKACDLFDEIYARRIKAAGGSKAKPRRRATRAPAAVKQIEFRNLKDAKRGGRSAPLKVHDPPFFTAS